MNKNSNTTSDKSVAWHALSAPEVLSRLEVRADVGLSVEASARRLAEFGANALPEHKPASALKLFLRQFMSPLIYLLLGAAGLAFFFGEPKDALVIVVVVIVNSVIGFVQEGRAAKSVDALRKLASLKARVRRGGEERVLEAKEIVPGDILILNAGDAVAADARVIEAVAFEAAEAALTGESLPVFKNSQPVENLALLADRACMVFSGTHVVSGRAVAVVTATGVNTEVGRIASLTASAEEPPTPLERRIEQFGKYLIVGAAILFLLIVAVASLRGIPFLDIFMIGVSQIVSMIPEGLPVAVTVALAVGVQRMAANKAIVRKLSAVEALGSISVICTDKTGTLTRNEMSVRQILVPGEELIEVTGTGYSPAGELQTISGRKLDAQDSPALLSLLRAGALCNDAQLIPPTEKGDGAEWTITGDPTEGALLTAAAKAGIQPKTLRREVPRVGEIPFDSVAKMMATAHRVNEKNFVLIKGAPETVLALALSDQEEIVKELRRAADRMAAEALRVLAFAEVADCNIDESRGFDQFSGRVRFLGLVGQMDPPREEAFAAVVECRAAGIRPVMVTGDHKATGQAIGKMLGIFRPGDESLDGRGLEELSDDELRSKLHHVSVFARVHPEQKLRIVNAFQEQRQVVAMTGDGVNDAPALAKADVGVAMGITGTDVAKQAAKIIITDDNFATIVRAVAEGRLIYNNIRKLILYLFSTGASEILVLFIALLFGYPPPLTAVMILWVNLVTDGAFSITLIMEGPEGNEMRKPPIPREEPIITRPLFRRIVFLAPAIAISTLAYFFFRMNTGMTFEEVRTGTFTTLVVCQWFNAFNCRSGTQSVFSMNNLGNPWLLGGLLLSNLLQIAVIFIPAMNEIFYTSPIPWSEAIVIGAFASLVLWVEEIRKWFVRRGARRTQAI